MHESQVDETLDVLLSEGPKRRTMRLGPLVLVDGRDRMVPTVVGDPEGVYLSLSERQFRQLEDEMSRVAEDWDDLDDDFGK